MRALAINISHNASAALLRDGEIVVAVQEERFTRKKNYVGYPYHAIDYCLKKAGMRGDDLDRVAYTSTESSALFTKARIETEFSLRDYVDYYGEKYYKRKLRGEDCLDYLRWLKSGTQFNGHREYFDFSFLTDEVLLNPQLDAHLFRLEQARVLGEQLGVPPERVEFVDHHTCHASYAYYGSPFRGAECIALTLDADGDGRNMTVWRVRDDQMELLADSAENELGRIYKMATLILGMRPIEDEFKVMGLAPYAKTPYILKALNVLDDICDVEGMRIVAKNRPRDLYAYLDDGWKGHRFDSIAGAVQLYTEQMACKLVQNIAAETGISRFVISGGIAMNVKMNKAIAELDEVDALFVCGSGGDETLSIGGCYFLNRAAGTNQPLPHLYLGYDIEDEIKSLDPGSLESRYKVTTNPTLSFVAELILKGDIVGVIRGRAEFGARALGNRSILASPCRRDSVNKINQAIKNRDFWMPFALSILEDHQDEYVFNPKRLKSPVMAVSFDTRPERYGEIEAGTHPYDRTVRPQFVERAVAPKYYALIEEFYRLSGVPALLNTSFNLHGEPIVNSIADAVRTFEASGLNHLLINDAVLLSK